MDTAREILCELARHSHQARGTDSYYPVVDLALNKLKELVLSEKQEVEVYAKATLYENNGIDRVAKLFEVK